MSGIVNRTVETAGNVASGAANMAYGTAAATANFAVGTVTGTYNLASNTASAAAGLASNAAHKTIDLGKVVVNGATTTVTAYTPNPILNLVTSTIEGARSVASGTANAAAHPLETAKPYVPTFVINIGEKTYEIVHNTTERTVNGVNATTGFIVTKVNGAVHTVVSVPQIHNLIEQLNKLTAPVLNKLGITKPAETVAAGTNGAAAAQ